MNESTFNVNMEEELKAQIPLEFVKPNLEISATVKVIEKVFKKIVPIYSNTIISRILT